MYILIEIAIYYRFLPIAFHQCSVKNISSWIIDRQENLNHSLKSLFRMILILILQINRQNVFNRKRIQFTYYNFICSALDIEINLLSLIENKIITILRPLL